MTDYPAAVMLGVVAECEARYPAEACGLIFEGASGYRLQPMANVIDVYHSRDPIRFPRTARTGYLMDPMEQLAVQEAADQAGERLCAVFHSHADVGAYFSEEDRAMALTDEGVPLLPGVEYLVLSVRAGRCDAIKGFVFRSGGQSTERNLPLS